MKIVSDLRFNTVCYFQEQLNDLRFAEVNKLKEELDDVSLEVDELTDRVRIIHSTFTKLCQLGSISICFIKDALHGYCV